MSTVTNVRLTTAVKANASFYNQVEDAFALLSELQLVDEVKIVKRKKLTIKQLFQFDTTPIIVFEQNGPKLYFSPHSPIYFHLDTVKVKLHMLNQDKQPILIEMVNYISSNLKTFNFVDGTMGFGRDSYLILKTFKHATVYAIEQNPLIYFVISEGMKNYLEREEYERIHFINDDYNNWIKKHPKTVEVLYLDHMFEQTLIENDRMGELSRVTDVSKDVKPIEEYKHLIVKAHYKSSIFKKLNVTQCLRKSSKTHYGLSTKKDFIIR